MDFLKNNQEKRAWRAIIPAGFSRAKNPPTCRSSRPPEWQRETTDKYQHTVEPLAVKERDGSAS
jgi:hypothetical protein